ncbi:MAG: hypothetical protein IKR22_03395 [Clostridiales bacterium]|nr:hypothetical protein [Clostridiales bacterium]
MISLFNRNSEAKENLKKVYEEKGFYCEEYVQAYLATRKKITSDDHFTLCELYIGMERYEDAQKELLSVHARSIMDDMTTGQLCLCKMSLFTETGAYKDASDLYGERVRFLDVFFKNPVRSRAAGDYYYYASVISTLMGLEDKLDIYIRRLREWCDIFPKNRILLSITETAVLFVKKDEKAGEALAECRQTILDFSGFKYEWERDNYLKKLERTARLKDASIG